MSSASSASLQTMRILWSALLLSVLIYGVVAAIAVGTQPRNPQSFDQLLQQPVLLPLIVVAIADFVIALGLPKLMPRVPRGAPTSPAAPSSAPFASPEMTRALIIQWALMESVAIFGLIGAFLAGDFRLFLGFAALSVTGLLLTAPSERVLSSR